MEREPILEEKGIWERTWPPSLPEQGPGPQELKDMPCGHHSHSSLLLTPPHTPHQLPCPGPDSTVHQEPERAQGGRDDFGNHREGVCGHHSETILGDSRAPRGLRISQSHHIQGHKYAMLFDPVIPLFGIPPKDIIARGKELYVHSCL